MITNRKYWWLRDYTKCVKRFSDIGFTLSKDYINEGNYPVQEYKYRPSYMKDTHYTLILFNKDDFRLYIHKNEDGSFVDTPFQISLYQPNQVRFIDEGLDKEFRKEILQKNRDKKINIILYE